MAPEIEPMCTPSPTVPWRAGVTSSSATNVARNSARVTGDPIESRCPRRSRTRWVSSQAVRSSPSSRSSAAGLNHRSSRAWHHCTHAAHGRRSTGSPRASAQLGHQLRQRLDGRNVAGSMRCRVDGGPGRSPRSQSASRTMPARRPMRSQRAVGTGRPRTSRAGTSPSSVIRLDRRSPRRSSSSRSASTRGTISSAVCVPGRPFHGIPAAASWCSTMRAYGRSVGHTHPHAVEPDAPSGAVDERPDGQADLVVGIGGRDDLDLRGLAGERHRCGAERSIRSAVRPARPWSDPRRPARRRRSPRPARRHRLPRRRRARRCSSGRTSSGR